MRRLAALGTALAVVLSLWVVLPAAALAPSLHFTADALPTWQTNGTVWGMAAAQGKVFAGGTFSAVRPPGTAEGDAGSLSRSNLVVLDAATGSPTSCVLPVTRGSTTALIRAVAASPDGATVYIGGLFEQVGTSFRKNVAAIDVASCTVKPFNPQPSSFVYAIAVTSDSVYFGGNFASVGGQARSRLGAATPAGVVLPWAPTTDDEEFAIAVDPNNGNVILGGRSSTINGQDSHALGIVDGVTGTTNIRNYPKGFFPWSPGTGQRTGTSVVKTIAVDATGFYVGNEGTGGGIFDGRAAFDWGTYDQRWRNLCLGATQSIAPVDGLLYSASHGHNCEAEGIFEDGQRHFFNAETAAGKQSQPWWPQANDGIGEGIGPRAIVAASSASGDFLWTGGEFTLINGVAQRGLARFGQGPDSGAPAVPQTPNVSSTAAGQVTVTWRTTTDDDDKSLTYMLYRGTSATPTLVATLQADSQFYSRPQLSFTDTGLVAGSSQTYRVKASDGTNVSAFSLSRTVVVAGAASVYPSKIVADGASVYFRMEEPNGTAAGSLGSSALGGTYVNASTRAGQEGALVGSADTSASFDGVSSFLRTEVSSPAPTVYSIETWFKTTSTTGGKLVGYGNRAMMNGGTVVPLSSTFDRQVYVTNDGRVLFGVNSGSLTTIASAAGLNNGQWHQVVATQGPAGMALYVDGARVARNAVTTAQAYSGFWRIGGDNLSGWPSKPTNNYFTGNIDETAIYDKALTSAQVADHFRLSGRSNPAVPAAPTDSYGAAVVADGPDLFWRLGEAGGSSAVDASGNNMGGTYAASVTRGVAGAVAGTADTAISTNGAATGIVYSAVSGGSPAAFSEELWFKTASTTGGKLIGFGTSSNVTSASYDKHVYLGTDGKLRFGVNAGGLQVITSPNAYNNNVWHHVVATQDGSGMKLYVDGAQVASGAATTNQNLTGFWRVGGDNLSGWPSRPTTDYFTGSIDEVAVYTKALTATQVQSHFTLGSVPAQPDTEAPTAPAGLTATPAGTTVNLSWSAATDNVGVAKYEVYRSAITGFTPDAATKIADVTSGTSFADATLSAGTWYYRVIAVDAATNSSAASAEASAVVAAQTDSQAPSAPAGVAASVSGQDVSVSWSASTDNVGVTGYEVYRSATSGFTPASGSKIGTVSGTTTVFADTAVTGGTWFYKVMAVDAAGNQSPESGQASAVVAAPADGQAPTVPAGLQAAVSGTTVSLTWTASTDNVGVAGYDVHRSGTSGFTPDASTKIGTVASGTTFSDTARPVGTWYYRVIARDAAGNSSAPSVQASAVVSGGAVQTVVLSPTEDTYAVQGTPSTNYGTSASMNSRGGSSSFVAYMKFTLPAAPAGTSLVGATLSLRTTTDAAAGSADSHVVSLSSAVGWSETALTWANRPAVGSSVGSFAPPTVPDARYNAILNAASVAALAGPVTLSVNSTSTDSFQFWSRNFATTSARPTLTLTYQPTGGPADSQAPSAPAGVAASVSGQDVSVSWSASTDNVGVTGYEVYRSATSGFTPASGSKIGTVSGTTTVFADTAVTGGTWFYKVIAVDAAGNQSPESGQASAVVAAPADGQAPTVPAGLQAAVSGTTVSLTWTASTDNVGVAGYDVHRSATSGFTPDASTKIGTVASGTTFSDTARPVGTWYYRVIARDAAGNSSAPSVQASAVVSGGAVQTVVLSPTEDTYAVQGTPSTNYGTSASMNSRGGSSSFVAYMKFTLPAAPAGTSLVGATLSLRTTTDAAAGSADSHVVSLSSAVGWSETALTWANRPAVGSSVGSFAPPTVPDARYNAILNAASVAALAGPVTLSVNSTSTDSFQFWSRNFATTSARPTLTLTYQ